MKSRWGRDKLGRPLQHTGSADERTLRAVGYQWEVNDRLRMVIDALEGPTEYRHDALGNLASGRYGEGKGELRMPDAVGNLSKARESGALTSVLDTLRGDSDELVRTCVAEVEKLRS